MRTFMLVSGLLVFSAAGVVGCGGGPCSDYCGASLECATAGASCELADEGKAKGLCSDACEAGLDAVSDSDGRQAVQDCLACIAPLYKDSCALDNDAFLQCQNECLPASNYIQTWVEAFGKELEGESILCKDGTPVGGGDCTLSSSSDGTNESCSVECSSGDQMAGAECQGAGGTYTCQCTVGAQQGKSFSSDCEALDSDVLWQQCK